MSRANTKLAAIEKRLAKGAEVPAEFSAFVALVTGPTSTRQDALNVAWSDFTQLLNVRKAAAREFFPFLKHADGGGVAFWKEGEHQHIVAYDSEGGHEVIALDFRDFLAHLSNPTQELRELIELDVELDTSELIPPTTPKPVPEALNARLSAWIESHSLSAPKTRSPEGEAMRKTLAAIGERMVVDGLSKVYTPRSVHWTMELLLVKQGESWQVTYRDYGKWHNLPAKYEIVEQMPALLPLMKSRKTRYELSIWKTGEVFVDKGNELAIEP